MIALSRTERFADWLHRHKLWLFGVWYLHTFVIHYKLIGYMSWDGFGYRTTPLVELLQHGSLNPQKFDDWTMLGYTPFIELIHLPFLKLFGMRGLLIGFPLVVFPLCVAAVYFLMREVTGSKRAATLGVFAYTAIPMVNQGPFTGYIDFAVAGTLAFWLYAIARLRVGERPVVRYGRLALATFLLTMARSQGLYIVIVLAPILGYAMFGRREQLRLRFTNGGLLAGAATVLALAAIPSIGMQIYKYIAFGSPIAPMQFQFLGIKIGTGVPIDAYFHYAGLDGSDLRSLAKGAFEGWVWHASWPVGAFFASRFMAAGLLFILAVGLLPVFVRHATRLEGWMIVGGVLVSLLSKDFAVPRWSYTTMIAISVIIGRSLTALAESPRAEHWFWIAFSVMALHLARPEFDILQIQNGYISPRMNVTKSGSFLQTDGSDEVRLYPNRNWEIAIIQGTPFTLQFYGQTMTNQVLGTIGGTQVGAACEGLRPILVAHPKALFVDDQHFSAKCNRTCVVPWPNSYCGAWQIALP